MNILYDLLVSECGQSTTEYMVYMVLSVILSLIFFLFVPEFSDGFNVLLSRILGGHYILTVW